MHRFVAIFLLLSIFFQPFATAGRADANEHTEKAEVEHAVIHWEGIAHHHDTHGSAHQDNSDESVQHILADVVLSATAVLLPTPFVSFLPERAAPPRATSESSGPSRYPDGLRRPPRLLA
jgi:hypothetical protein